MFRAAPSGEARLEVGDHGSLAELTALQYGQNSLLLLVAQHRLRHSDLIDRLHRRAALSRSTPRSVPEASRSYSAPHSGQRMVSLPPCGGGSGWGVTSSLLPQTHTNPI